MKLYRAGITGLGMSVPEKVLTNADFERMVETSDEWIYSRTGMKERHIASETESTSDFATLAAQRALEQAGVDAKDIDLLIVATVTPDMSFPATACLVQGRIGATRAATFDLEAACAGFVYGCAVASQFIATGTYERALVIGAETLSKITNYGDRSTCVLFGDGAGAAVIERVSDDRGIEAFELGGDGLGAEHLKRQAGGSRMPRAGGGPTDPDNFIYMNGREVFKFAVRVMGDSAARVMEKAGYQSDDVALFVPHQANVRIIDSARERIGLSEDRVFVNIEKYGNTSSASIPIALFEAQQAGRLHEGDRVILVGFGGGLTWASMAMRWGK